MTNKKNLFLFLLIPFLAFSCSTNQNTKSTSDANYNQEIKVSNKKLFVSVADTEPKREQGLSGQEKLTDEQGMIFIFDSKIKPAFWMVDMKFDLDLIWIDGNKIIGVTENVPIPPSCREEKKICDARLPFYYPPSVVDKVLEVNSGWTKKNNIQIGDTVEFEK